MQFKCLSAILAVMFFYIQSSSGFAGFVYTAGLGYATNPGLVLSPGQTTSLSMVINEIDIAGANPPFSLSNSNLRIPLLLERTAGDGVLSNLTLGGPNYSFIGTPSIQQNAIQFELISSSPAAQPGQTFAFLANASMTMGTSPTTTFRLTVPTINPFPPSTAFLNNTPIAVGGGQSITFTAVPEPTSLLLVGVVGCAFAMRLRKRSEEKHIQVKSTSTH